MFGRSDQIIILSNPSAFEGIDLHEYFHDFKEFIENAITVFWIPIGLATAL